MAKCIRCGIGEAVVPDRNTMSRRKKVCLECHRKDLSGDIKLILALHKKAASNG